MSQTRGIEEVSRWIEVGKKLPVDGDRVLTYTPNAYTKINIHAYHKEYWSGVKAMWVGNENHFVDSDDITHWTPLPETPPTMEDTMSDTLRINPPPPGIRPPTVLPPHDDLDELRDDLADAEARIKQLENAQSLLLEDSIEAKHRIEALETALAAVVRALSCGVTSPPLQSSHQHALCWGDTARRLAPAARALNITVLGLDEEGD